MTILKLETVRNQCLCTKGLLSDKELLLFANLPHLCSGVYTESNTDSVYPLVASSFLNWKIFSTSIDNYIVNIPAAKLSLLFCWSYAIYQNTLEAGVWPCVCFLVKRRPDGKTVAALKGPKTRGTAALIGSRLKRANGTAFSEEVDCTTGGGSRL